MVRLEANHKLASFRKPPLHEVALSVQFESLTNFTSAHAGLFWHEMKRRFPVVEEHPALSSAAIERSGARVDNRELVISQVAPKARLWLMDSNRRELIQIQHDRFIRNWRKTDGSDPYPRYDEHVRPRFEKDFCEFCDFVRAEHIGEVRSFQCEVAYFNQICTEKSVWNSFSEMHKIFSAYSPVEIRQIPLEIEALHVRQSFAILLDSDFKGRFYVEIEPAEVDGEKVVRYHLTARGRTATNSLDDTMAFMDLGRELIVDYFEQSTSSDMHKVWEKE